MRVALTRELPAGVEVLRIGADRPERRFAVVSSDVGEPFLALDLRVESSTHEAALFWRRWLVVGFGTFLHLVNLESHGMFSHSLDAQFVALHPLDDTLLVTSTDRVRSIKPDGLTGWTSAPLRSGAKILSVRDGVIEGESFRLSLATGR